MKRILVIEIEGPKKDVLHAVRAIRNVSHMADDRPDRYVRDIVLVDDPSPRFHSPEAFTAVEAVLDATSNLMAMRFQP